MNKPLPRPAVVARNTASPVLILYLTGASFLTYFCMYAFRKPFVAATFGDADFLNTRLKLKTALILGQVIGYALSKFLGIKLCSEASRRQRGLFLIGCITFAELSLVLFALVPGEWKVGAIFLNGLPLGMVWGLVVSYLEGRRTSEILLAGLSCSFIVSSGVVKDVGVSLLRAGVSEAWMPAAVGGLFLGPFLLGVWLLERAPEPDPEDVAARVRRTPMDSSRRWQFVAAFWPALVPLLIVYFFLTAFRDYRDNYGKEIYDQLGHGKESAVFTRSEIPVALAVLALLVCLYFVRDNRRGMSAAFGLMLAGTGTIGLATGLHRLGWVDGFTWMQLLGFGAYLAYVPFGSVLFDRLIAATRFVGTAVFAIYLADAVGYVGAVLLQVQKDLALAATSPLHFLQGFSVALSLGGTLFLAGSWWYCYRQARSETETLR